MAERAGGEGIGVFVLVDAARPEDAQHVRRVGLEWRGEKARRLALVEHGEQIARASGARLDAPCAWRVHPQQAAASGVLNAEHAEWRGVRASFEGVQAVGVERGDVLSSDGQWRYPGPRTFSTEHSRFR